VLKSGWLPTWKSLVPGDHRRAFDFLRCDGQKRTIPFARLVAGRHGRPNPRQRVDSCGTMVAAGVYMLCRVFSCFSGGFPRADSDRLRGWDSHLCWPR
jgi:hypothetical protein